MDSIIVVEDEPIILELVTDVLQEYGYPVRPFECADHAWAFIQRCEYQPRLLITDLQMQGKIDGVELVKRVHLVQPQLPVIIASGFHAASIDVADEYVFWLPKPFNIQQLSNICGRLAPSP